MKEEIKRLTNEELREKYLDYLEGERLGSIVAIFFFGILFIVLLIASIFIIVAWFIPLFCGIMVGCVAVYHIFSLSKTKKLLEFNRW